MLLSVITPDKQPGMERMLLKELEEIDAEIIIDTWDEGLKKAGGDFVCFLEKDSAVSPGSIVANLKAFTDKPAYRKLAMVSPSVDLPNLKVPVRFSYNEGMTARPNEVTDGVNSTRIGYVPGAIIRTSSLKKANITLDTHPNLLSCMLSLFFWENGLRIAFNSKTLYYAPENASYEYPRPPYQYPLMPSGRVSTMWEHEIIS